MAVRTSEEACRGMSYAGGQLDTCQLRVTIIDGQVSLRLDSHFQFPKRRRNRLEHVSQHIQEPYSALSEIMKRSR